jgi:hypothetical protein
LQARAGGEADQLGQLDVTDPSIPLQMRQNVDVDAIKFDVGPHASPRPLSD